MSMVEFVLEQYEIKKIYRYKSKQTSDRILNYANFLNQKLELGMFVPTSLEGNVLIIIPFNEHKQGSNFEFMQHKLFEEAKERCLFEGFTVKNGIVFTSDNQIMVGQSLLSKMTVENMVGLKCELTPTALKTIGL